MNGNTTHDVNFYSEPLRPRENYVSSPIVPNMDLDRNVISFRSFSDPRQVIF